MQFRVTLQDRMKTHTHTQKKKEIEANFVINQLMQSVEAVEASKYRSSLSQVVYKTAILQTLEKAQNHIGGGDLCRLLFCNFVKLGPNNFPKTSKLLFL